MLWRFRANFAIHTRIQLIGSVFVCSAAEQDHSPLLGGHSPLLGGHSPLLGAHSPLLGAHSPYTLTARQSSG